MYITITETVFIEQFRTMGRFEQFGYEALKELFNHIEHFEQDTGEQVECDVIAFCCDWSVKSVQGIIEDYSDSLELPTIDEHGYTIDEMDHEEIAREVSAQLDTYCYELADGNFLICDAMI